MNAVHAGAEIHRPRAERIAGAAGHEARQIGLARDHLGRRMPIRPFRLAADGLHAGPGKTFAADADAVSDGAALAEHVVERGVAGIDHDGAGRFGRAEGDDGAAQPLRRRALVGRDHFIGGIPRSAGTKRSRASARSPRSSIAGDSRTALARTSALATRDEGRRSKDCVMGLPRWDAHHWMLCTNKRGRGRRFRRPTLRRPSRRPASRFRDGTFMSPARYGAQSGPRRRFCRVIAASGRGKPIVSVIPTKPLPAKPSAAKHLLLSPGCQISADKTIAWRTPASQRARRHAGPRQQRRIAAGDPPHRGGRVRAGRPARSSASSPASILPRRSFLPITMAFIVGTMLSPAASFLERHRIPRALAAVLIVAAAGAGVAFMIGLIASPVMEWSSKLPELGALLKEKLHVFDRPLALWQQLQSMLGGPDTLGDIPSAEDRLGAADIGIPVADLRRIPAVRGNADPVHRKLARSAPRPDHELRRADGTAADAADPQRDRGASRQLPA